MLAFELTTELADEILEAEEVCYNEGIGPVSDTWMRLIVASVRLLAPKYDYVLRRYDQETIIRCDTVRQES